MLQQIQLNLDLMGDQYDQIQTALPQQNYLKPAGESTVTSMAGMSQTRSKVANMTGHRTNFVDTGLSLETVALMNES
jgi:hypothetical protein